VIQVTLNGDFGRAEVLKAPGLLNLPSLH